MQSSYLMTSHLTVDLQGQEFVSAPFRLSMFIMVLFKLQFYIVIQIWMDIKKKLVTESDLIHMN